MAIRGIDEPAVTAWLAEHVPGATSPFSFELVAGGHSCLTYVVTDAAGVRTVLRRPPLGSVLATAHDVLREHRIISALTPTKVPTPVSLAACADVEVNGAPFFVMGFVEGTVLHSPEAVEAALPDHATRDRTAWSVAEALAELHRLEPAEVGLGDLSRPTGYLDRQLRRWRTQFEASTTRSLPEMGQLGDWLEANRPVQSETRIVHGDFRLGNMIVRPDGTIGALLDWELCTLGDPMADVAYLVRSWASPDDPRGATTDPPTRAGGFPSADELLRRYAELSGRSLADVDYWLAFNAWRSAAIAEGVLRRYRDGAMGHQPEDLRAFELGVEQAVHAGMVSAGLA